MKPKKICFVAGEASGDRLGRDVVEAVQSRREDVQIMGIGGQQMASVGASTPHIDISPLAVLGFVEGLKAYPTVLKIVDATVARIISAKPDCVVLIDSWGFCLRVAQRLREQAPNIRLIKLIGPQVWATRPGRAKTLAQTVDHLLCIHDFEAPYYHQHGLAVTVIGNPALSRAELGDGARFRAKNRIAPEAPLLLVLPGSRPSEISRVGPAFSESVLRLKKRFPDLEICIAPASGVRRDFYKRFPEMATFFSVILEEDRRDAMAAATVALACSGTVTTELAVQSTPFVVGYKLGWLTWAIARAGVMRSKYITLLNVAADDEVAPEFVQTRLTAGRLERAIAERLENESVRSEQLAAQNAALAAMGYGQTPAHEIAADAILKDLGLLDQRLDCSADEAS